MQRIVFSTVAALACAVQPRATSVLPEPASQASVIMIHYMGRKEPDSIVPGCITTKVYRPSMAIGVVEFSDNSTFADTSQLQDLLHCIADFRRVNNSGVIVLAFAHGWHHDARWDVVHNSGDVHFREFRRVMMGLALREAERPANAQRRVVGIYLGWRGRVAYGPLSSVSDNLTFWSRLSTAERIGKGAAIRNAVLGIVDSVKGEVAGAHNARESPLIFAGHSMGALMIETAFLSMLRDEPASLLKENTHPDTCASVRRGTQPVYFPDLVLLLNAATDSRMARETRYMLEREQLVRQIHCGSFNYSGPVFISVTSERDMATKTLFPLGKQGHKSEGHDQSLFTHSLVRLTPGALCRPKNGYGYLGDYGQRWHCLRAPVIVDGRLTSMAIDLPQKGEGETRGWCHVRYRLRPVPRSPNSPFWILQVPGDVIDAHSDIFNARSNLFIMALAQASGGVLSLADTYVDVFEDPEPPCQLVD